ncbi:MAG: hypothetical protein ACFE0Q_06620 [Anaerolineae bacterium]
MFLLIILTIITFIMSARAFLVVIGAYKDPLLASFEHYGEEQVFSPLLALIIWTTAFIYMSLYWYIDPVVVFLLGIFVILPIAFVYQFSNRWLYDRREWLLQYPRWYHQLIENTDREERRRIAYLWLFLPPSTRMVYNANTALFWQWVEQVLLTVAQ